MTTNQAVCALIPKANLQYFNYLVLSNDVGALENLARGSAQQNISKGIVETMQTVRPLPDISRAFEEKCMPPFEKWISNLKLNERLSALRDTLLPKLLSGELPVPVAAILKRRRDNERLQTHQPKVAILRQGVISVVSAMQDAPRNQQLQ